VVLGFNCADKKEIALEFMAENGAKFPTILDASDAAMKVQFQGYRGSGVPLNYIINRDGKILDTWYGYYPGHARAKAAMRRTGGPLAVALGGDANAGVAQSAEAVTAAAHCLFQTMRTADYDQDWADAGDWGRWLCAKCKANPITDVRLGKVFAGPDGMPTIRFELRLKDGEALQGDLSFQWDPERERWIGRHGLDWHLRKAK
jgi:hypothetical protein